MYGVSVGGERLLLGIPRGQNRMLKSLELQFQAFVNALCGHWELNSGPL